MRKMRNFKTLTAVTLAASMVVGGAMNVWAAQSGDASSIESEGTYEGGEMKYPALSVTLPTIAKADYDYIADPNGLITATDAAKYSDSEFVGDGGIYFKTTAKDAAVANSKNVYSEKSGAKTVTNENAQNIDVTVKLEQGSDAGDVSSASGDTTIAYAASNTFSGTARELYLAVTDGTNASALTSVAAATLTTTVEGRPSNYEADYDSSNGYEYKKKDNASGWRACSFYLTGALNKGAEWGDGVKFPSIKVTWSYEENKNPVADLAPSINGGTSTISYSIASKQDLVIPYNLGSGNLGAGAVTDVVFDWGDNLNSVNGTWNAAHNDGIVIGSNSITLKYDNFMQWCNGSYKAYVVIDGADSDTTELTINCN